MVTTIALFGATGDVGGAILEACLDRGLHVRALVRGTDRLPPRDGLVVREQGDVLDPSDLESVLEGADAAVTALGTPPWSLSTITANAMQVLLPAMQRQGVDRLIAISAHGVGDSRSQMNAVARLLMSLAVPYARDKQEMERLVRGSDTRWTLIRPWMMSHGEPGDYVVATKLPHRPRPHTFEAVGDFVAGELLDEAWVGEAVSVSGH